MIVFTDLLEEAAARPLLARVPVLARRHAVVVASPSTPPRAIVTRPSTSADVTARVVARDVLAARERAAARVRAAGARVRRRRRRRPSRCVAAYLSAKARAGL